MGVESGSQKILNAMDKGLRVEEVIAARNHLRREGIRTGYFLQLGYPGETVGGYSENHRPGSRNSAGRYRRFIFLPTSEHAIP